MILALLFTTLAFAGTEVNNGRGFSMDLMYCETMDAGNPMCAFKDDIFYYPTQYLIENGCVVFVREDGLVELHCPNR